MPLLGEGLKYFVLYVCLPPFFFGGIFVKKFFSAKELAAKVGGVPQGRVLPCGTHAFGLSPEAKEAREAKASRHNRNMEAHAESCRLLAGEKKAVSLDNRCGLKYGAHKEWAALSARLEASLQP